MTSLIRTATALAAALTLMAPLAAGAAPTGAGSVHADRVAAARAAHVRAADTEVTARIAGADRYDTAAQVASHWAGVDVRRVWVAAGESYPDALAASATAGGSGVSEEGIPVGEPVLLTEKATLPAATLAAIKALAPAEVVVVGGAEVVTDAVPARIAAEVFDGDPGRVTRVAGADRWGTAAAVAAHTANPARTAYLATGRGYADALSAGWAAATQQAPVLLTDTDRLPAATRAYLVDRGVDRVVIVGGPTVVSDRVRAQIAALPGVDTVERVAGQDRYSTSTRMSRHWQARSGESPAATVLATGENFPDALAGGAFAGSLGAPLLLTDSQRLPGTTAAELTRLDAPWAFILGGESVVAPAVEEEVADLLLAQAD